MKTFLSALLVTCAIHHVIAADFIVTNTNDSGPDSLRQALTDANSSGSGPQRIIKFQIPGEGVHTINLASPLPSVPYSGVVDGYTQPGARPNSLAAGTDAVLLVEVNASAVPNRVALQFSSFYSVVRGLVLNGDVVIADCDLNQVSGCYVGTDAHGMVSTATGGSVRILGGDLGNANRIGGTTPADRNVIATSITIGGSHVPNPHGNTIQGNYVGVASNGNSFLNPSAFVSLSHTDNNTIGGSTGGAGNVIAGSVGLSSANRTIVQGNLIGTTGLVASPGATGLSLGGNPGGCCPGTATNNIVSQNVIVASDKVAAAISLFYASNNVFRGNLIGVGTDGKTRVGNSPQGINFSATFYRSMNNTVGGPSPGDGNIIMFGSGVQGGANSPPPAGIAAVADPCQNIINGNSISGTGGLGIDLGKQGVTPNDPGDADGIQNYPVLTSAVFANGSAHVTGTLNSVANTSFRVELLGNDTPDPSGYGQGQSYLGFTSATTDADGNATFDVTLPVPPSVNAISSTATGPSETSEFSASIFAKLLNISTRANVQSDENIAIAGFIITGADTKQVLVRGIGPSMTVGDVPVAGRLSDPVLDVWDSSNTLVAENDNWEESQLAEIEATGLAPADYRESAALLNLAPGMYTAQLRGVRGDTGIGLIEVYDLAPLGSQLANISTRSFVGAGDNVMIAGCIVAPNTGRTSRVLVRGIGPSLSGVSNRLPDPVIELRDENGLLLATNDDWKTNQTQIEATGMPPTDDRESALVADLLPSNYTVVLSGKNSAAGVAVVELYRLP